ncbi:hypothetical protein [uncultured Jatrophihabitans sp.]|uniref:hypothetical protein n=1 Tax=uncultured Jatrophihabitans sp. TaxID=1610747 RepID=UPI0035CC097F
MIRRVGAIGAAIAAALTWFAPAASAGPVPYTDPQSVGTVTLCGVTGQVATHGDIHTKPFVWRAVGSAAPPSAYAGPGRTAALYGYQPIENVDPQQWNGEYLTFSAAYTSKSRPMAAATPADPSLADLLGDYPTKWDGLLQLRLFVGAPGLPGLATAYSTATIRVSGNAWTLVNGGRTGCDSGSARSGELALRSVAALPTPAPNATTDVAGPAAVTKTGSASQPTRATPTAASVNPAANESAAADSHAAAEHSSSSGPGAWLWVALACLLLVGGIIARLIFVSAARRR